MSKRIHKLVAPYLVTDGGKFKLRDVDPDDDGGIADAKTMAKSLLEESVARLSALQEKLYAQDCWGVLLIFQAMDAAGKDGAIKHVMSGVNPQGVQVYSFKQPSSEELDHDFLWRCVVKLPERGRIGIFNRSYYEDVLVVRVHDEFLQQSKIPKPLLTKHIWKERYEDISGLERYLARNGYIIRKFFLHISPEEQLQRLRKRLEQPEKNWKFSTGDVREHLRWEDYMDAYEDVIQHTADPNAPWVVVPANRKWFARLVVASAIVDALEELNLDFPTLGPAQRRELQKGREMLNAAMSRYQKKGQKKR